MLRVKHLLSDKESGGDIWFVEAEDPVRKAIEVMAEKGVGALPVMRGNTLVGMVSERDYARKVILLGRSSAETPVWQIMASPVVTVTLDDTVHHCMQLVTEQRIRHLPVMEKSQLIGIVSIGDLVKAVMDEQQQTITQLEQYIAG
ncbi:MAG: CBS domain-containing protein [Steroidobacteraceae bacterium]